MASDLEHDVATVLTADHREMERLAEEFDRVEGDPVAGERIVRELTRLIVQHALAEEQVLYPVMAKALPDGESQVAEAREEHKGIERTLEALEQMQASDAEFGGTVRSLMLEVIPHAREEEADLFPALRREIGDDEMRELGGAIEGAKKLAPTRPHPLVPNTPAMRTVAAPAAAVVDRVRDRLEAREGSSRVPMVIAGVALAVGIVWFARRASRD